MNRDILSELPQGLVGAVIILAVAYGFIVYSIPGAQAAGQTCGEASWYGKESCVNKWDCRTANRERYTGNDMTAAHRTLPFGTKIRVTFKGKSVTVRINDRGPAGWTGRVLDLSEAAAKKIGLWTGPRSGTGKVCWVRV